MADSHKMFRRDFLRTAAAGAAWVLLDNRLTAAQQPATASHPVGRWPNTALPTAADALTGVPISRITSGEGLHMLPYYTANALNADERFLCCSYDSGSKISQAWIYSMETGKGHAVSNLPDGIQSESVAFHSEKPWLFYSSRNAVYWYDLATEKTQELFRTENDFLVKSEISVGRDHVIFQIFEWHKPGQGYDGQRPGNLMPFLSMPSYVIAVHIQTGVSTVVWGENARLTHPVISPVDENLVLYANQGSNERLQELFTVPRVDRDHRKPVKLYQDNDQRPIYVGHAFFTLDGWVGTQMVEFGGRRPDGSFADMVGYNAIIKPDGTCDRRARCPGGNKPVHVHAARADSWWVGDTLPMEGAADPDMICIMKNKWETGYCQAEPLLAHGCTSKRPQHVHPRFTRDEKRILFISDYPTGTGSQIYVASIEEFLANWKDRVPFTPRPWRYCYPPSEVRQRPKRGPNM